MAAKAILLSIVGVLYAASFALPAGYDGNTPVLGYTAFVFGAIWPAAWLAWSANPVVWFAFRFALQGRPRASAWTAAAAFVLAVAGKMLYLAFYPMNLFGPAFWVWSGSMGLLAAGSFWSGWAAPMLAFAYPDRSQVSEFVRAIGWELLKLILLFVVLLGICALLMIVAFSGAPRVA